MQTKPQDHQSVQWPSRAVSQWKRSTLPQRPAALRSQARPPARRYGGHSLRTRLRLAPIRRSGRPAQVTPTIRLISRGMFEPCYRQARKSSRPFSAFVSLLALLAFACFPVLAQADSSGIQYSDAPPTATGGKPSQHNTPANSANADGGASVPAHTSSTPPTSSNPSTSSGGNGKGSSVNESPSSDETGSSGSGGSGQGNPDKGSSKATANHQGDAANSATQQGRNASASSDGGSSPVLPILIAVLALAAISVGAVVIRQRRQRGGPGSPVSPNAN